MKRICTLIVLTILTGMVYAANDTIIVNNKRYVVVDEVPIQEQNVQEQKVQEQKVQEQKTTTPKKKSTFWTLDKLTYGGGFGFNLNSYEFYV
ncbi:MAG: hypothetical protein UHZ06_01390, partial [Paludibacteraceae bacterium]|nr:hypothetical protein [Paludibacteraceae bacterium]